MRHRRIHAGVIACLTVFATSCVPSLPTGRSEIASATAAAPQMASEWRYQGTIDPMTHAVTIAPADFRTQAAGIFVRSANAVWTAPTFAFDLLVTNHSGAAMASTAGVVLSTAPAAPSVTAVGTSGLTGGLPYYDYGVVADGATATANWRFAIPGATPFRFVFTIRSGAGGTDAGPVKNKLPAINAITPASPSIGVGTTTSLTASAADPDADPLTYAWSAPGGGSITGSGSTVNFTAPGTVGTYPVDLTVDDGRGGTATTSANLSVVVGGGTGTSQGNLSFGNVPTSAIKRVSLSPATLSINPGQSLPITATALDNPGNPVASKWFWSQTGSDGTTWRGTFGNVALGPTANWFTVDGNTRPGTITVTARSSNNVTGTMTVTVNDVPSILLSANPAGATVTASAGAVVPLMAQFHDGNGTLSGAATVTVVRTGGTGSYGGWGYSNFFDLYTGDETINLNVNGFSTAGSTWLVTITDRESGGPPVSKSWTVNVV